MSPTNFEDLKSVVKKLGLPHDNINKSASGVSLKDIHQLGWIVHTDDEMKDVVKPVKDVVKDVSTLWTEGKTGNIYDWVAKRASETHSNTNAILRAINTHRKAYMIIDPDFRKPVTIAKRYQLPNNSLTLEDAPTNTNEIEATLLKVCLHYIEKESRKVSDSRDPPRRELDLVFKDREGDTDYPEPNFHFPLQTVTFAKERAVVSLLRVTTIGKDSEHVQGDERRVSELTVERLVGSALSAIFVVKHCDLIAGSKLEFPAFLRPGNAVAFPDIATLRQSNSDNVLRAVVAIGEGKIQERGMHRPGKDVNPLSKTPNVQAQIAAAIHPTMILLVINYYLKLAVGNPSRKIDEIQSPKPGGVIQTEFKEECLIYGVYYDEAQIIILAHFPR
ncbi:hypothetical protein C8R43DRAFT_996685, partial [Mycena crocata]